MSVDKITDKDISLVWKAPKSDGGSRIKKYKIYKKTEEPGSKWVDAGIVDSYKTNAVVSGLSPDEKYLFAVMAENEMGLGEMAETDRPVSLQKPISKYNFWKMNPVLTNNTVQYFALLVKKGHWPIITYLTLYHTIPNFNDPEEGGFENILGKGENAGK